MKNIVTILLLVFFYSIQAQTEIDLHLNKAQKAIDEDNYTDAIKHISKALEYKKTLNNSYKIANLYVSRGMCRYKLKNYSEADSDMDLALKTSPDFLKAFEHKNTIYFDSRQFDKIISNSNKALELNPKDTKFLYWISEAYIGKHDYKNALVYSDSILHINQDDISTLRLQSSIYHRLKKYEKAIEADNLILTHKPNDAAAHLNRSINYASLKEYEKAENDNIFAAKIDTSLQYVAYNNTAYFIKLDAKDYTGAIELFDKCIKLKPDFAYAYSNRGFCKLQLGDIVGANKDIQKSLELDPNNSYAYKNYALVKLKQNKINEACGYLKKANDNGYSAEYDEDVNELLKTNCK